MRVVIVGAGIGGLTAAGLLGRSGHEVVLLEKTAEFGQVGAGIQISPNASRIVGSMGLADALAEVGTESERVVLRRWDDDRELLVNPSGRAAAERYGHPQFNVYRPDLLDVLVTGLGDLDVRFGAAVVGVDPEAATVNLADGSTVAGDVVIGADGIKSSIAASLFGHRPTRFRLGRVPGPRLSRCCARRAV